MPTIWILPPSDSGLSEIFSAAGWPVSVSGNASDVVVYDVGSGQLSDDFRTFCQMKFFPLLALATDWDVAWQAVEAGADDVMVKPINSAELLVRARKLIRQSNIVRVDNLAIDLGARRVRLDNCLIALSPIEFRLLACLAKHIGEVVSFDQMLDTVWGNDSEKGGTLEQVRSAVKHLRQKIERDPRRPTFILTSRGFGFRLRSQAQWEDTLR